VQADFGSGVALCSDLVRHKLRTNPKSEDLERMLPVLRYALRRSREYLLGQLQPQMHDDGFANSSHQLNRTGRLSRRLPAVCMGHMRMDDKGGVHATESV
jgi:hypothetical protein